MSLPLYIAAAVPIAFILLINAWWDRHWKLRNLPTPAGASLIWGHEKFEFEDYQGLQWRAWFNECGRAFKIKAAWGHPDILIIGDTVGLSHIYTKNPYNYQHSPFIRPLIILVGGRSLVWVEGEKEHKRMRSLIAPAFSSDNIRNMHADVYHVSSALQTRIANEIHASGKSSLQVNILNYTTRATLDIIGRVAFGHDFNAVCGDAPDAIKIINTLKAQNEKGYKQSAFTTLLILRLFPWITSLPLKAIKAQSVVADTIRTVAKDIVANSQIDNSQIDNKGNGKDLMSRMLQANACEDESKHCGINEIYEHIVTSVVAGHDTTSKVLAFTMWALAQNPDIQSKLHEEVRTITGEPTYDDFVDPNILPYLDAVCKEAMRMFPPSTRSEKVAEEDDVIPLRQPIRGADGSWIKSIPVKKGQVIHIPSIGINRDEAVFGDADTFRPTRWLVGRGDAAESKYCTPGERGLPPADQMCGGWSGLFTFTEGPRICVGMRLALFEYKAILTTLIRSFQFHDTGIAISMRNFIALLPSIKDREHEGLNLPVKLTLI